MEGDDVTDMERVEYIKKMAENLPTLRTKLNMTQEELATLIGVSRSTVILFEKGQRQMTWNTFLSLILIFSKNPDTNKLMKALDIYTDELENIFRG
jgi:DNA-binding XRE family transcriptional regulator